MSVLRNQSYTLIIPKHVHKELASIDPLDGLRIIEKLKQLAYGTANLDTKKLAGFRNLYRLRVGKYRVIYEVQEAAVIVYVVAVGHRSTIYQKLKQQV